MSGAPVCLAGSSTVVGVVSGRYNSLDGWFRDAVWVARVEDLEPLLSGVAQVTVAWPSAGESLPVRAVLEVDATRVRLRGGGTDVSGRHQGISFGLESAVNGFSRHRTNLVQWAEHRPGAVATTGVSELLAGRSCRTRWPRGWPGCWPGRNERISRSRSGCARRTVRPSHEC
jgi:hypothetical protein